MAIYVAIFGYIFWFDTRIIKKARLLRSENKALKTMFTNFKSVLMSLTDILICMLSIFLFFESPHLTMYFIDLN